MCGYEIDFRSDLYSAGATLYALLTGHPPFEGKQAAEVLAKIAADPPAPFEQHGVAVPKGLQRIIFRALAKDPNKRYQKYSNFRSALLPYSSQAMKPTTQGRRMIAYCIDSILQLPFAFVAVFIADPLSDKNISGREAFCTKLLVFKIAQGKSDH